MSEKNGIHQRFADLVMREADQRAVSEYTPTTEEVLEAIAEWVWSRRMFRPELGQSDGGEATRWLAAHDAEVRAAALDEQGTEEWEYGLTWEPDVSGFDEPQSYSGCETEEGAWETGRQLAGDAQAVKVWKRPMRPAVQAVPAGPWVPVEEPNRQIRHEEESNG